MATTTRIEARARVQQAERAFLPFKASKAAGVLKTEKVDRWRS